MSENKILSVKDLKVYFPVKQGFKSKLAGAEQKWVKAVNNVSFEVSKGETVALVGESGCGKTTIGKTIVRLNQPTGGKILFKDEDIFDLNGPKSKAYCKQVQYIFQDPYSSLNPQMTVMQIVRRPLDTFNMYDKDKRDKRVLELLSMVGIAANQAYRYPHEFSGGQRQRISIARALAVEPSMLIADEPTSALDVSIQCQILDLLSDLRKELNLTMVFISHDLGVVNYISDRVLIMYLGQIVESGPTRKLFASPSHPYTKALLEALPARGCTRRERKIKLEGYIPSPIDIPKGCTLHPRCPFAQPICESEVPEYKMVAEGHSLSCHFALKQSLVLMDN